MPASLLTRLAAEAQRHRIHQTAFVRDLLATVPTTTPSTSPCFMVGPPRRCGRVGHACCYCADGPAHGPHRSCPSFHATPLKRSLQIPHRGAVCSQLLSNIERDPSGSAIHMFPSPSPQNEPGSGRDGTCCSSGGHWRRRRAVSRITSTCSVLRAVAYLLFASQASRTSRRTSEA